MADVTVYHNKGLVQWRCSLCHRINTRRAGGALSNPLQCDCGQLDTIDKPPQQAAASQE